MNRRTSRLPWLSRALAATLPCLLAMACGSSSSTPLTTALVGSFTPDALSPEDGSVTLQPGTNSENLVGVRVSVRGIPKFFGAAFWISYDTAAAAFATFDGSTSFLRDDGAAVTVRVDGASEAGKVKVGISRYQNADGKVVGVDVTAPRDLIVLYFLPRKSVASSPVAFVSEHGEVVGPETPPQPIPVTWAGGSLSAR